MQARPAGSEFDPPCISKGASMPQYFLVVVKDEYEDTREPIDAIVAGLESEGIPADITPLADAGLPVTLTQHENVRDAASTISVDLTIGQISGIVDCAAQLIIVRSDQNDGGAPQDNRVELGLDELGRLLGDAQVIDFESADGSGPPTK
jgi:hypothetical protein